MKRHTVCILSDSVKVDPAHTLGCSLMILGAVALSVATAPIRALGLTLTMDDLPRQPVQGLVHPSGISFGFTVAGVPSLDAEYNDVGPGSVPVYLDDPTIEGPSNGVLEIVLPGAFESVQFGVAVNLLYETSVVDVELFDAANASLGVQQLTLSPLNILAEGLFIHDGVGVSRIRIDPTPATGATRFAVDNLFVPGLPVPEPASVVMLAIGLAGLSARRRSST